jgi:hypothetical protein
VNDHDIPHGTLLGVALRGSILLVVGTQVALALRGDRDGLAALAAELRGHADLGHLAEPEREALERERVIFSTPIALSGATKGEKLKGMTLAVVTDSALHLLERGERRMRIPWATVSGLDLKEARFGPVVQLVEPSASLEILYLTEAQIQTIRGLAGRPGWAAVGGGRAGETTDGPEVDRAAVTEESSGGVQPDAGLELESDRDRAEGPEPLASELAAADAGSSEPAMPESPAAAEAPAGAEAPKPSAPPERRAPSPTPERGRRSAEGEREGPRVAAVPELPDIEDPARHFRIPEFELSLGSVGSGSDRPLAAAIDRLQMVPVLPVGFLDEHLRELRGLWNGGLVKRKREAAAAADLASASRALDGEAMWEDLVDRVGIISDAMLRAFERQARRLAADRRLPWRRARKKYVPGEKEVAGIRQRLMRAVRPAEAPLATMSSAGAEVRTAMRSDRDRLRTAYRSWLERLHEGDEALADVWTALGREAIGVWQDNLVPRLNRLGGERRRWLPWPARMAIYLVIVIAVALVLYLLLSGRLSDLLTFS